MKTTSTSTQNPFTSDESKAAYNQFKNAAWDNYNNVLGYQPQMNNSINAMGDTIAKYQQQGGVGDTSYFKQGWNGAMGIDQSNLNKMNTQDLNPYNDEVTNNYVKASNRAADLAKGQYQDQMNQNIIGSGMRNGSGHQTAAAKVGAQYAANINAQNQQTYLARQNQLEQNALAANNQLGNFYNTLSNIGIDYARLNQQDLSTLLNAYQQQANMYDSMFNNTNNALKTYGNAVLMGSDPTQTSEGTEKGTKTTEGTYGQREGSWGQAFGNIAGMAARAYGMGWL